VPVMFNRISRACPRPGGKNQPLLPRIFSTTPASSGHEHLGWNRRRRSGSQSAALRPCPPRLELRTPVAARPPLRLSVAELVRDHGRQAKRCGERAGEESITPMPQWK